jgi:hypothetical protein
MPGAPVATDELDDPAVAPDIKMGRNLQFRNCRKKGIDRSIQPVQEKILDPIAAELVGRQADVVDDNQRYRLAGRPIAEIGGWPPLGASQPAISRPRAHSMPRRSSR